MSTNAFVLRPMPGSARGSSNSGAIDLLALLHTLWRNKFAIISVTAMVTAVALVYALAVTPLYRAASTLQINDKNAKVVTFDETKSAADNNSSNQYMDTQLELLRSRAVISQVVQKLNLLNQPEFDPRANQGLIAKLRHTLAQWGIGHNDSADGTANLTQAQILDQVAERFLSQVTVEQLGKTQLVKIQVDMADATMAATAANAVADAYIEHQIQATLGQSSTATAWINGRLGELGQTLKESEDRLQAYKEAEHLVDIQGVSTISVSELSLTGERMIDARRQRAEAESQFRQVQKMAAGGWTKLASIPAVLADPLVQRFKAQQAKAQAKVDELAGRYGPRHPAMEAARSDLVAATTSLRAQVEQVVAGIERAYQLASANEGSLQDSFNANKSQIQDISRKEFQLRELQREVDGNRALYDTFMTRLRETGATSDLNAADIRIIDPAVAPTAPVKPRKSIIVALAALIGLLAGSLLAWGRQALDGSFRSIEQVEDNLALPVLGIVPKVARNQRKNLAQMYSEERSRSFCEAIRTIRTALLIPASSGKERVIVVTSTVPGEGKSSLSINLATALGQLERVLVIDADLRRSTLTATLGLPPDTLGLTDLVKGSTTLEQCVQRIKGVDVLCTGRASGRPLEVLSSARMRETMQMLRGRYDRIIVDSPPLHAVSDTQVLANLADSVLFVIQSHATPHSRVEKALARLSQGNATVRGVVLNRVDIKRASRSGYRYDGLYDYYQYSSKKTSNRELN